MSNTSTQYRAIWQVTEWDGQRYVVKSASTRWFNSLAELQSRFDTFNKTVLSREYTQPARPF